jgi:hypothetical protein
MAFARSRAAVWLWSVVFVAGVASGCSRRSNEPDAATSKVATTALSAKSAPSAQPGASISAPPSASAVPGATVTMGSWHGTRRAAPPKLSTKARIDFGESISLESPDKDLGKVDDKKIVLDKPITVLVEYPVSGSWEFPLAPPKGGWTQASLARSIADLYHHIYEEEARTSKVAAGHVPGLMNRDETNGTFGVWGHDLGDLVLEGIDFDEDADGKPYLDPAIGS